MQHATPSRAAAAAAASLLLSASAQAATLYDPALGTQPSAQGWSTLFSGSGAVQSVAAGRFRLDTTAPTLSAFGHGAISPVPLNTATGFDLSFTLQITSEAHTSSNRAGYSVVLIGADPTRSLELAFWSTNVWAYDYDTTQPDRFVHGLDAGFDTTAAHSYVLSVRNQQYTLRADGNLLLGGSLHDYTAAGLPYSMPNFVFFGDNSSRGVSVSQLGLVNVTAVPEPASAWLMGLGVLALSGGLRVAAGQAGQRRAGS